MLIIATQSKSTFYMLKVGRFDKSQMYKSFTQVKQCMYWSTTLNLFVRQYGLGFSFSFSLFMLFI